MLIVAPTYISSKTLVSTADVLYHGNVTYFMPTGFHPTEIESVATFPSFCHRTSIKLPRLIWEFCSLYFENSEDARKCLRILEPLRKSHISVVTITYPRNRAAIEHARQLLFEHPSLMRSIRATNLDMRFVAREVLS